MIRRNDDDPQRKEDDDSYAGDKGPNVPFNPGLDKSLQFDIRRRPASRRVPFLTRISACRRRRCGGDKLGGRGENSAFVVVVVFVVTIMSEVNVVETITPTDKVWLIVLDLFRGGDGGGCRGDGGEIEHGEVTDFINWWGW